MDGVPFGKALWFYMEVTPQRFPWAFAKANSPGRVIAALELLATTVSVMLFGHKIRDRVEAQGVMTASTDNQGNSFAMLKYMSSKWPLTVLIMELSEQLRQFKTTLALSWRQREHNIEADAITNQAFEGFDPRLRLGTDNLQWLVLDSMMEASQALYQNIVHEREARASSAAKPKPVPKLKASQRMKVADPW